MPVVLTSATGNADAMRPSARRYLSSTSVGKHLSMLTDTKDLAHCRILLYRLYRIAARLGTVHTVTQSSVAQFARVLCQRSTKPAFLSAVVLMTSPARKTMAPSTAVRC